MNHLHCQHPYKVVLSAFAPYRHGGYEIPFVTYAADGRYSDANNYGSSNHSWDLGVGAGVSLGESAEPIDQRITRHLKDLPKMFEIGIAPLVLGNKRGLTEGFSAATAFLPTLDCRAGVELQQVREACDTLVTREYMPERQMYSIYATGNSYHVYFHQTIPAYKTSNAITHILSRFLAEASSTGIVDRDWANHSLRFKLGPVLRWTSSTPYKSLIVKAN